MLKLSMMSSTAGRVRAEKVVEIARSCGFDAVEWINSHGSSGKDLRRILRDAGLATASYTMYDESFVNRDPSYPDRFKEHLETAVEAGAPVMMIPPFARIDSKGLEEDRKEWIGYFEEVFPMAESAGITLTLESTGLPDSPIVSAAEVLEVLHAVPGLKLVFDTGNTSTADDVFSAFRKLEQWIVHIHLKDNHISVHPAEKFTMRRNGKYMRSAMIGTGNQDLHGFLKILAETGYERFITLESSDPDRIIPIEEALRSNIELIRGWERDGF